MIILVLGGARSGKSSFAERLASTSKNTVCFVVTAKRSDAEMKARIERHILDREQHSNLDQVNASMHWITKEEPLHLSSLDLPKGIYIPESSKIYSFFI